MKEATVQATVKQPKIGKRTRTIVVAETVQVAICDWIGVGLVLAFLTLFIN